MRVSVQDITPKKAAEWLKRNVNNRPIRQVWVANLASAMSDAKFVLNGESIKFNQNGDLIDGQHRLLACIKSGVLFTSYVVHDLPVDAYDTIDQGARRGPADVLARRGEKHYVMLAAACNAFYRWTSDRHNIKMRPDQLDKILLAEPDIRGAVDHVVHWRPRILEGGLATFLLYYTSKHCGERAFTFWQSVLTADGLKRGTPAYTLYKRLEDAVSSRSIRLTQTSRLAFCVKAFNAHIENRKLSCLKFSGGSDGTAAEEMPKFCFERTNGKAGSNRKPTV